MRQELRGEEWGERRREEKFLWGLSGFQKGGGQSSSLKNVAESTVETSKRRPTPGACLIGAVSSPDAPLETQGHSRAAREVVKAGVGACYETARSPLAFFLFFFFFFFSLPRTPFRNALDSSLRSTRRAPNHGRGAAGGRPNRYLRGVAWGVDRPATDSQHRP